MDRISKDFFDSYQGRVFSSTSRLALGPILPPLQWVQGFSPSRSVKVTTHLHVVPRLCLSWHGQGPFYFVYLFLLTTAHCGWCVFDTSSTLANSAICPQTGLVMLPINSSYFPLPIKYKHISHITYINPLVLNDVAFLHCNCGFLLLLFFFSICMKESGCHNLK